jgi:hypothetical protein
MPSPFRKDQLSPEMVTRYGLDRRPWGTLALVLVVVIGFAGALAWITISMGANTVSSRVINWDDTAGDHVTMDFEVQRDGTVAVECALRAQDRTHIDVGYAVVQIPAGDDRLQLSYALRTIAPAYTVEVLGCAAAGELQVAGPQFPPAVVPPEQPFTP